MRAAQWDKVRKLKAPLKVTNILNSTLQSAQKVILREDVPIPELGEGQVLVRIKAASLCHSDLMQNLRPDDGVTYTLGHEGVGVIEKIHSSAEGKGFNVGDPVGSFKL